MPIYTRWSSKPPQGTLIDRTHDLANGLIWFGALNEAGGLVAHDLFNAHDMAINAAATWSNNSGGEGLLCNAASAGAQVTVTPFLSPASICSVAIGLNSLGNPAANAYLGGILYNISNSSPFFVNALFASSAGAITLGYNNAGTAVQVASGAGQYPTGDHVFVGTVAPGNQFLSRDGVRIASATNAISSFNYSATSFVDIGANPANTTNPKMTAYWLGVWNRGLTVAEHARIGSSVNAIWQMMQPPTPYWLYRRAVGGFQPWIYGDQIQEMYG